MNRKLPLVALLAVTLVGCATLTKVAQEHPIAVQAGVTLTTVKYLKANPKRAVPMEKNVVTVRNLVEDGTLTTVDMVVAKAKELLLKDPMFDEYEAGLASVVIDAFAQEAIVILEARGFTSDLVQPEAKAVALQVLDWTLDAVKLMQARLAKN